MHYVKSNTIIKIISESVYIHGFIGELIGEIIGLLQSPTTNVISALLSGKNKLAGIVKTLSERE